MYKTKDTSVNDLKGIVIRNQDIIIEKTGRKLDPVQAYEIIKEASSNFSKADPKVVEADALLHQLLQRDKQAQHSPQTPPKRSEEQKKKAVTVEEIQIQERERARKLKLLKLKLTLDLTTKSA